MKKRLMMSGLRKGGIGYAIAHKMAVERHWTVYACEMDVDAGEKAVEAIRKEGGEIHLLHVDVSSPEQVNWGVEMVAKDAEGKLDALINNAGHAGDTAKDNLHDLDYDTFWDLLRANLGTAFLMTQAVVKRIFVPQGRGHSIFLSTNNGAVGSLGQLAYGCAKQAVACMARELAAEYAYRNIRFNTVSPGIIETDSRNWQYRRLTDPDWAIIEGQMNPTGRVGQPKDVAGVIAFLLSDDAAFINACDLVVDGGLRGTGVLVPGIQASLARQSYVGTVRQLNGYLLGKTG